MKELPPIWLTIDSDDLFHHPKFQGHPTRSKMKTDNSKMSSLMSFCLDKFESWHQRHIHIPITIFIIAQQLECDSFNRKISEIILKSKKNGGKITIGCHGYKHKCWSAFAPNKILFEKDLELAKKILIEFAGDSWRPWFRAPGGYVAPWMAEVLKKMNFELDSSVNPSKLLSIKSGKRKGKWGFNGWNSIKIAMKNNGIIERPWLTTGFPALPVCGPALHIPILKYFAKSKWKRISKASFADEKDILNSKIKIITLYWHLLDYGKKNQTWEPPLRIT